MGTGGAGLSAGGDVDDSQARRARLAGHWPRVVRLRRRTRMQTSNLDKAQHGRTASRHTRTLDKDGMHMVQCVCVGDVLGFATWDQRLGMTG